MRHLHVVGSTPDGAGLLLSTQPDGRATHVVAVDVRLDRALRGSPPDGVPDEPRLSVAEIQARLRAGVSLPAVAAAAGVPPARIERYAGPVQGERDRVITTVQAATLTTADGVRSALPVADAVLRAVTDLPHARPETLAWSAFRRPDGTWVARVDVVVRGRRRRADFHLTDGGRRVTPADALAWQLAVAPKPSGRGRRAAAPASSPPASAAPRVAAARPAAARTRRPAAAAAAAPARAANPRPRAGAAPVRTAGAAGGPAPARATPARATPARATPARATPARATPARATPARATPARATPAPVGAARATPARAAAARTTDPAGRAGAVRSAAAAGPTAAAARGRPPASPKRTAVAPISARPVRAPGTQRPGPTTAPSTPAAERRGRGSA